MWFFIALVVGAAFVALEWWTRRQNIVVTWYDRLIGAVGVILLLFTLQFYIGSQLEFAPGPANFYLLVVGLPGLLLIAVAGSLIWRRRSAG